MEDIVWTDHGKNEAIVFRVKKERNILHTLTKRKGNWMCQIGHRKSLLNHITEGTIEGGTEVTGRQERGCRLLLNYVKGARGYWKVKEEAQDCTLENSL